MYSKFKKILLIISFLLICLIGLLFINTNENEIFAGFRNVIVVEKSPVDFSDKINEFVAKNDIVLARRIVAPVDEFNKQIQNTYVPIGAKNLPKELKQQTDNELIENSSYNTVYVVVSGSMNAEQVAEGLLQLNATVRVLPTNYETALFRLLLNTPQSVLIVIGILITYISLILAQQVSGMKEVGILRVSGKGKHAIAIEQTKNDSIFILCLLICSILGVVSTLIILRKFSILALLIILVPVFVWALLIFIVNFFLSHCFYYILQHQPIILSIKGKAPLGFIFVLTILIQLFTLFSVMFCVYGMISITREVESLEVGKSHWQRNAEYYEITSLEDGDSVSQDQKEKFFNELSDNTKIIYRNDMLDNMLISNKDNKNFEPTSDYSSNVIYVNANYVAVNKIKLSDSAKLFLKDMKTYDKMILIPNRYQNMFEQLKNKWEYFEKRGFSSKETLVEDTQPNSKIASFIYEGGDLFTYPVYSLIGRQFSNEAMVHDPIIVVEKPNYALLPTSLLIVNHSEKVTTLIRKYNLTASFGSLTSGLLSIEKRIDMIVTRKYFLLATTVLSITTSFLLFILMNSIYFYQERRTHFIERLAGKNQLRIHRVYLGLLITCFTLIGICTIVLRFSFLLILVPFVYLLLLLIIFGFQLIKEKRVNILFLKGA